MSPAGCKSDLLPATVSISYNYVEVQSLSSLLGITKYAAMVDKMGPGSRHWGCPTNVEKTFEKGFHEKIKKLISNKYNSSDNRTANNSGSYHRDQAATEQVQGSGPHRLSKGMESKLRNVAFQECESRVEFVSSSRNKCSYYSNVTLKKTIQQSPIPSTFTSRVSTGTSSNIGDVLRESLNNSEIHYVEIEGHLCSKRMLSEWAVKYLRHSILRTTIDNSTQTEPEAEPEPSSPTPTSSKLIECKPDCADASTETDVIEADNKCANTSVEPAIANYTQPNVIQQRQQQPAQSTAALHSLMGSYFQNWGNNSNYYGQRPNQYQLQPQSTQHYEAAKNWKPKDEDQTKAFEQAKTDVYNVLVVCKGCAVRYFKRLFYRTVEETLDLNKIGVPNLETLLVQMGGRIFFKKERYTSEIYIYPNIGADQFEGIAHIGELVAEQRDKEPLPNSAVLVDCDVRELFENRQQSGTHLYQNVYYSTAHRGNSPYSYAHHHQAYANNASHQSYYNTYQYQIPSSSTNVNTTYQQSQREQWLYQQLQYQTNCNYNNYNYSS